MGERRGGGENLWDAMGKQGFRSGYSDRAEPGADLGTLPDGARLEGHPYFPFLHRVEKPGRYIGGEVHSIRKPDAALSIALAFPDLYEIGMSHLGLKILYAHLNQMEGVRAERVYAPWPDLEAELRERALPLVTLETWTPLCRFDCVGFSLQYELTFTNILTMLDLGRIPIHSAARADGDALVMAGGPVAFQPEPLAPFIDAFLLGDGERYFHETVALWAELRRQGVPRRERLRRLSALPGIYVPALYRTAVDPVTDLEVVIEPLEPGVPARIHRAHVPDINAFPFPARTPVANTEIVFDRASIEIARGCTEGCRFCQAGMIYRPVRERDPEQIREVVRDSVRCGGFDEVALTSLSTADYSAVEPLVKKVMEDLRSQKVSLSVSSLRAYGLSEALLDEISSVRNTSLTFAPEAGTQRMRDVVNKNISEEDIVTTAHRVFSRGWQGMKLYFMIGLPTETEEDVRGIAETGRRLVEIGRIYLPKGKVDVTVSVSSHVPKPFTPFQWAAMDDIPDLERKHDLLRDATRMPGLSFRWHEPHSSHLEGIISRGDRRIAAVVERAWRKGCRFDSWGDHLRFDLWMEAIEEEELDRTRYLRTLPVDGRVPWDHIHCGVEWDFLIKEYRKALKGRLSPPCGKPFRQSLHHTTVEDAEAETRKLVCFDCGVACDLALMRDERLGYLRGLDAHRVGAKPPAESADEAAARIQREFEARRAVARAAGPRARPRPPARAFQQGTAHAYRIRYTKLGRARFISHLDLNRLFPRAARRAGLDLTYSEGFHPQPQLSYGPPLRLGLASIGELLEMKLNQEIAGAELVARLDRELPDGVAFRDAERVDAGMPRLSRLTAWAEYLVFLPAERAARIDAAELERFGGGAEIWIERRGKDGTTRRVDAAPGIQRVAFLSELPADARPWLALAPEDRLLEVCVALTGGEMVRPEEVLMVLFGGDVPASTRIVRKRLLPAPTAVAV